MCLWVRARAFLSLPPAPPQTHPPTVGVCVAKRETRACLLACVDCRDKERERESECSSQPVHCFAFFQPPTTIALAAAFCCSPRLEVTYGQKCPFSFSLNHNCRVLPVALLGFNYSLVFFFFGCFFVESAHDLKRAKNHIFLQHFFCRRGVLLLYTRPSGVGLSRVSFEGRYLLLGTQWHPLAGTHILV